MLLNEIKAYESTSRIRQNETTTRLNIFTKEHKL